MAGGRRATPLVARLVVAVALGVPGGQGVALGAQEPPAGFDPFGSLRPAVHAPDDPPWTVDERRSHWKVPGVSAAVLRGGRLVWWGVAGVADPRGTPLTPETRFQVASLSKPVTAYGTVALAEAGTLELDADVSGSTGAWTLRSPSGDAVGGVTLRMLLSHSAGVGVPGFPGHDAGTELPTTEDILEGRAPARTPPVRVEGPPGEMARYSGGGYLVVQHVIEVATGRPFAEVVRDVVLEPLAMGSSDYDDPDAEGASGGSPGREHGHDREGRPLPGGWRAFVEDAAAGLFRGRRPASRAPAHPPPTAAHQLGAGLGDLGRRRGPLREHDRCQPRLPGPYGPLPGHRRRSRGGHER